jgi:preprotein translocase subunit SecD
MSGEYNLAKYKYWLVFILILLASIYSLPMLYPDKPALQLSAIDSKNTVDITNKIGQLLRDKKINLEQITLDNNNYKIVFADTVAQRAAQEALMRNLGDKYTVALYLAQTTPRWLASLGARPMKLGLDLRGGVYFLLEVDTETVIGQHLAAYVSEIKELMRSKKWRYRSIKIDHRRQLLKLTLKKGTYELARTKLRSEFPSLLHGELQLLDNGKEQVFLTLNELKVKEMIDYAIGQNLTTLRNRVNELGVSEPLVQRQGKQHIAVQLPGVQNAAAAKQILGATANLEFRLEAGNSESGTNFSFRSNQRTARLQQGIIATGDNVVSASASFDENSQPQVNIKLDSKGGKKMMHSTSAAIGERMAVVFIEHKASKEINRATGKKRKYIEKGIISLATIQTTLGNQFRITGLDSQQEASNLALLLRAGALAAPVYIVQERTIGPSLGQQNIDSGVFAIVLGFILVLIFMALYYRVFGVIANFALILNVLLVTACMSLIGATLTLPGMAGIVLTIGMAVDANVLIFSRIKEELKNGVLARSAIDAGYNKAFTTIIDANITTLLAAIILFAIGTGPVKGFAITLSLGILTSMFSAIVFTRCCVHLIYNRRTNLNKLSIGNY